MQPDLADPAVRQDLEGHRVHEEDLGALRAAAADQGPGCPAGLRGLQLVLLQTVGIHDQFDVRSCGVAAGDQQGVLGQSVTGEHGLGAKSVGGEARAEGADRAGAYGLGPVERHSQGGQVESGGLFLGDPAGAQLVAEVG